MLAVSFLVLNLGFLVWKSRDFAGTYGSLLGPRIASFGALAFGVAVGFVSNWTDAGGIAMSTFGWVSLLADAATSRLPTLLTVLIGVEVGAGALLGSEVAFRSSLLGAFVWIVVIGLGFLIHTVGRGDVFLAPIIGFWLGDLWLIGLVITCTSAGIWAVVCLVRGRTRFPFGPFLVGGSVTAFVLMHLGVFEAINAALNVAA